eukprot:3545127-Alexandrium_andersonii.AAC.1
MEPWRSREGTITGHTTPWAVRKRPEAPGALLLLRAEGWAARSPCTKCPHNDASRPYRRSRISCPRHLMGRPHASSGTRIHNWP